MTEERAGDVPAVVALAAQADAAAGVEDPPRPPTDITVEQTLNDLRQRSNRGYGLGLFAIAGAVGLAVYSFCSLRDMAEGFKGETPRLEVFYVNAAAHVVITVAVVWFIYQLLRAAERMVLPRHLQNDAELARTLLGINSPQREIARTVQQLLGLVVKLKGTHEE